MQVPAQTCSVMYYVSGINLFIQFSLCIIHHFPSGRLVLPPVEAML